MLNKVNKYTSWPPYVCIYVYMYVCMDTYSIPTFSFSFARLKRFQMIKKILQE